MPEDKISTILRIYDNETHLLERADQKSISLLSILGVFMVFFIVYYRIIPVNPFTVSLISAYFLFALLAIVSLIMTLRPRIQQDKGDTVKASEPAFFARISEFPDLRAYKQALEDMCKDDASVYEIYVRQIYSLAQVNSAKYKHLQRATFLVVFALIIELAIIAYLFINYMGEGALPPII